jgi:arabinofuranan 3-O-arabinosyltransferase
MLTPIAVRTTARPSEPLVRSWTSVDRVVSVVAADHPRLLELTENANAGWVATLDGRTLVATTVDGWRQAWVVPAGASGDVEMTFAPDRTYRAGLVAGAAAVGVLLLLALVPARRRRGPAASLRTTPSRVRALATGTGGRRVVVAAAVVLVGGAWGALAVVVGALVLLRSRHRARWVGLAAVAAGVLAATAPWPGSLDRPVVGAAASVLALLAVTLACWPWSAPGRDPSTQA